MASAAASRSALDPSLRRSLCAALAVIAVSGPTAAARQENAQNVERPAPLVVGKAIKRELSGGRTDVFQLRLSEGQFAAVRVEERGIDVVVDLIGPEGAVIVKAADSLGNQGHERLDVVAHEDAVYDVRVRPVLRRAAPGTHTISLLEVRTATARDTSLHEARKLSTEADRLMAGYQHEKALPSVERALAIAERTLEADDLYIGFLQEMLGRIFDEARDYARAQSWYERAINVLTARLGADHPRTVVVRGRLGNLATSVGDYATADKLLTGVLHTLEKVLGKEHPMTAVTLRNLGVLYSARGDSSGAEQAHRRALADLEKSGFDDPGMIGSVENNLGVVYLHRRQYQQAGQHLTRALTLYEQVFGPDHLRLATLLQNLGIIARENKDYATAERYYQRTLQVRERGLGPDHPHVAAVLNNLANLHSAQRDYAKSLELHRRALSIWEDTASPWDQRVLSLGNIARVYAALGDFPNALAFQARVDAALETNTGLNLAIGSERQKLAYLNSIGERTHRTVSLHLQLQPDNPDASRLAALVLLQRKARVLDAMTDTFGVLRVRSEPEDQQLLDQLSATTTRFARLVLQGPGETPVPEHRRTLQDLQQTKEALEASISRRSDEFRVRSAPVTLEAVQAAVPDKAAVVDFALYRPFDVKADSISVAYGKPRYAMYVLRRDGVQGRDLGDAGPIDDAIEEFREALQDPARKDLQKLARALDEKVMQPVRALAGDATRFLVSPDGQLALVPMEALVDERGRYLVERYSVSYLSAGRDLLRMEVARASMSPSVVIADPLFGEERSTAGASGDRSAIGAAVDRPARRSITTGVDVGSMYFAPLAGTRHEARSIRSVFPDMQVLTGAQATEWALKKLNAPRMLHIATHGFFLEDEGSPVAAAADNQSRQTGVRRIDNPLLRSGLALSGANLHSAGGDDGILTALEAAHLNLWGTKLVTLSACDTGVGVVRNGDGVYGLRRSIFLAGAETLVMSLWPVSDYVTREMMTAYYKGLKQGLGRGEALRRVQLSMLNRKGREHPFYWASFIQAGEWASLDGQRRPE